MESGRQQMRLWTRKEIQALTGFSLWKIDRAIKLACEEGTGGLVSMKIGGSRRISHPCLAAWLGEDPLAPGARISIVAKLRANGRVQSRMIEISRADTPTLFEL